MNDFILNIFSILTSFEVIGYSLFLIFLNILFIKFWKYTRVASLPYVGEQIIHKGIVSPLGGLSIYIWSFSTLVLFNNSFNSSGFINRYIEIFYLSIPLMLIILFEDLVHDISIKLRLIALFSTAIYALFFWVNSFPVVELPPVDLLFESKIFTFIFFTFCLVGLMNGANFIDGMNGLAGLTFLVTISVCLYLCSLFGLMYDAIPLIVLGTGIFGFLVFNFPFGKIFLGDSGAYFISFFLGLWLINFIATNTQLSSWIAALLFFYPSIEVVYSFTRKVFRRRSPFQPDVFHLHRKIFDIFFFYSKNSLSSNILSTFILCIFWLLPALFVPFFYDNSIAILEIFVFFLILYIFFNLVTSYLVKSITRK